MIKWLLNFFCILVVGVFTASLFAGILGLLLSVGVVYTAAAILAGCFTAGFWILAIVVFIEAFIRELREHETSKD